MDPKKFVDFISFVQRLYSLPLLQVTCSVPRSTDCTIMKNNEGCALSFTCGFS